MTTQAIWKPLKPGVPYDAKFGAYVNGVGLFELPDGSGVMVTGYDQVKTREEAEAFATEHGISKAAAKMSEAKFNMFVAPEPESEEKT